VEKSSSRAPAASPLPPRFLHRRPPLSRAHSWRRGDEAGATLPAHLVPLRRRLAVVGTHTTPAHLPSSMRTALTRAPHPRVQSRRRARRSRCRGPASTWSSGDAPDPHLSLLRRTRRSLLPAVAGPDEGSEGRRERGVDCVGPAPAR
jgi:hypothetical protein